MLSARGARTADMRETSATETLRPSGVEAPKGAWLTPRETAGGSTAFKAAAGGMGLAATTAGSIDVVDAKRRGYRMGTDVAVDVRPAGKSGGVDLFFRGLRPDVVLSTPRTPEGLGDVRMRHRKRTGPGDITVQWGMHDRRPPDPGDGYGTKNQKGEDVAQNFKAGQVVGIAEYMQTRGESIYKSTVEEPLGKGYVRGHALPGFTRTEDFPGFGKATDTGPFAAKEVIFPRGGKADSQEVKAQYRRTHGSVDPGEMVNRNYGWPKAVANDPHFKFGITDRRAPGERGFGAREALSVDAEDTDGGFPKTFVVNKASEHYKSVTQDALGASRNLMQRKPPVPPGHAFGVESGADRLHVGDLIRGFYSDAEQLPDHDLGAAPLSPRPGLQPGSRHPQHGQGVGDGYFSDPLPAARGGDHGTCTMPGRQNHLTGRRLGIPTIRSDMVAPPIEKRSVANSVNYGDDLDAFGLIFPGKHQMRGLSVEDIHGRRNRSKLKDLFDGAGLKASQPEFDALFSEAVQFYGDGQDFVSMDVLMSVFADWAAAGYPALMPALDRTNAL